MTQEDKKVRQRDVTKGKKVESSKNDDKKDTREDDTPVEP